MGDLLTLPVAPRERLREVHSYGYAAGLVLVLMLDTDEGAHLPLRLAVVGPEPLGVEIVAITRAEAEQMSVASRSMRTMGSRCSERENASLKLFAGGHNRRCRIGVTYLSTGEFVQ